MTPTDSRHPLYSIGSVERDTGLTKDTLRVWERRYGFPAPLRDAHGERVYSAEQVEKLRTIKRLLDRGHRPGRIIERSLAELVELADAAPAEAPARELAEPLHAVLTLVRQHRVAELRQELGQAVMRQGLAGFLTDTVAPLNRAIGDAWMRGQLEIFEEHLYTETMQSTLRGAIASIPQHGRPPRVLLTTFPNEQHQLGLLMAEAMFALEGATCVSLGTQTPIFDIVMASESHRADIVALSFSAAYPAVQVADGLEELRTKIPRRVAIWAGGGNAGLQRRAIEGVHVIPSLVAVGPAIAEWQAAAGIA
ncbi:MAG: MerR family transcriptional regulator [Burkholderiales bacterium]|jgi:DNA-binding transcriptional MerR regulator/methylmalonyl-CoA mutase cobalamin-binding subunit|nr:MerR family transcriptional regulator [Burkholderiales bacterium]